MDSSDETKTQQQATLKILKLSQMRVDGGTQLRFTRNGEVVHEYAELHRRGVVMPPLEVIYDGTDYWLVDGYHRLWGAELAGLKELPCRITEGTKEDARWAACAANKTHGLKRSNYDKIISVQTALRHPNGPTMSDNALAEHCGVSHTMVAKYRAELGASCNGCKIETRTVTRNGKTYEQNTSRIGRTSTATPAQDAEIPGPVEMQSGSDDELPPALPYWDLITPGLDNRIKALGSSDAEITRLSEYDMEQQLDIMDMIGKDGICTLGQAMGQFDSKSSLSVSTPPADQNAGKTTAVEAEELPLDAAKQVIPPALQKVLADKWYEQTEKTLKRIVVEAKVHLQKTPYWIKELSQLCDDLKDYAQAIGNCQPAVVCPACKGKKKDDKGQPCGWCQSSGVMPAWAYRDWKYKTNNGKR